MRIEIISGMNKVLFGTRVATLQGYYNHNTGKSISPDEFASLGGLPKGEYSIADRVIERAHETNGKIEANIHVLSLYVTDNEGNVNVQNIPSDIYLFCQIKMALMLGLQIT